VTANGYISPELVGQGFVVVDVRTDGPESRTFDAQFLQEVTDVSARIGIAVQWLRAHADEFCVAPEAIAVTGYSYGGIAVLALAYTDGEVEAGELVVVDPMGAPVVSQTRPIPVPVELAAFSNDPDAVVAHAGFALADTIDAGEPPALLFHGRNDPQIPFALAEQTCAAAQAVDIVCEIVAHDEGHAFAEDNLEAVELVTAFLEREMVVPTGLSPEN
jgi:dipeptidyl aminopeptidase/acylaminoacyl peptidase